MFTCWNDNEDDALQGLPWPSQLLYLRGLRWRMDYETGWVGRKSRISWQTLRETLHVEHHQGMKDVSLSKEQLRRALQWLVKAGLVIVHTEGKYLQFLLPLADTQQSDQKKAAPRPHHVRTTEAAVLRITATDCSITENEHTEEKSRTTGPTASEPKAARHQISNIKHKKPYTEAVASVSEPALPKREQSPISAEPVRQASLLPPVVMASQKVEARPKAVKPRVSTAGTWTAYSIAYRERYGVDPLRNGTVNGQLAHLVRRLGDEAPDVARYYLDLEDGLYRREGHSVGVLLKHCEHLRTLWARSRKAFLVGEISADDVVVAL